MSEWFLIALVAPFLWSIVTMLDVYFADRVYEEAHEGTIISGLFQGSVLLLVPFIGFAWPGDIAGTLFIIGGMAFIASFHWYFKSMILVGDGPLVQIVWNFTALFVPVLAWALAGEHLSLTNYIGIGLAFAGGSALAWDDNIRKKDLPLVFRTMFPAILFFSASMVIQKRGYEISGGQDFWSGFVLFSFGAAIGGVLALLTHPESKKLFVRIGGLGKKYFLIFFAAEGLSVAGTVASQRAISLAPGVSLVAAIESLVPLFVMLNSLLVAFLLRGHSMEVVYRRQVQGLRGKLIAIVFISMGIYLVTG